MAPDWQTFLRNSAVLNLQLRDGVVEESPLIGEKPEVISELPAFRISAFESSD